MSNNVECADYFKGRPEYKRCFQELRRKWKSYGRAAGRITLEDASKEECRGLGGIVGRTFDEGTVRFLVAEFEAGLQRTRFAPVELGEVLACYFGEALATNQEQRRREQGERAEFFEGLIAFFERQADGVYREGEVEREGLDGEPGFSERDFASGRAMAGRGEKRNAAAEWMKAALETKKYGYQLLVKEYVKHAADAEGLARAVGRALCVLAMGQSAGGKRDVSDRGQVSVGKHDVPERGQVAGEEGNHPVSEAMADMEGKRPMPYRACGGKQDACLSEKVSVIGQPLAVFAAKISGNPHYFDRGTTAGQLLVHGICFYLNRELPGNAHEWRELLLSVGLMPDNVSSIVHAYGLRLRTEDGYHLAYEAFCVRRESCVITLENLRGVIGAEAVGNAVYVVENEMVFSYLAERVGEKPVTILCTSGQPRTAALELFSFFAAAEIKIYYSGDIDPEGIDIADRLWQRYGEVIQIWRMAPSDYEKSISAELVDEVRLAKLGHVRHPLLRETVGCVREKRCAGYQENLLEALLEDVVIA